MRYRRDNDSGLLLPRREIARPRRGGPCSMGASQQAQFMASGAAAALWPYSVAVLHFDGTNNSTTITDNAASPQTWTSSGNGKLSTTHAKFGTASLRVSGVGHVQCPDATALNPGLSDWTMHAWVWLGAKNSALIWNKGTGTGGFPAFAMIYNSSTDKFEYTCYSTGGAHGTGDSDAVGTKSTGQWYHVALTRASGQIRFFVDGVQQGSAQAFNFAMNSTSTPLCVGNYSSDNAASGDAWVDDYVFLNGIAQWTANFTPPVAAFPDS